MLNPLWQSTETYISYNDVVDKWGAASALQAALIPTGGRGQGLDLAASAVTLNIVFPDKTITQIIKDLSRAQQSAVDKATPCRENVK